MVRGHGFHPLKARQPRSIPNLQSVHRQGRTPIWGPDPTPIDTISSAIDATPLKVSIGLSCGHCPFTRHQYFFAAGAAPHSPLWTRFQAELDPVIAR